MPKLEELKPPLTAFWRFVDPEPTTVGYFYLDQYMYPSYVSHVAYLYGLHILDMSLSVVSSVLCLCYQISFRQQKRLTYGYAAEVWKLVLCFVMCIKHVVCDRSNCFAAKFVRPHKNSGAFGRA